SDQVRPILFLRIAKLGRFLFLLNHQNRSNYLFSRIFQRKTVSHFCWKCSNIPAMKAGRMRENRIMGSRLVKAAGVMLAVAVVLFSGVATAFAQERPRTLFDLLFGSRQAQPQRQYERPAPQRARPKPK